MKNEYIREAETFEVTFTDTDLTAQTVMITISNETGILEQHTANYVTQDDKRVATLSFIPDLEVGEYEYMYTVTYTDSVEKFPDVAKCKGKCDLPKFVVCEANDITST